MLSRLAFLSVLVAIWLLEGAAPVDHLGSPTGLAWPGNGAPVEAAAGQAPARASRGEDQVPSGHTGSDTCGECHAEAYEAWAASTHGTAGGPPSSATVIAPFDGRPIQFSDATVTPRISEEGDYIFRVERPERPVQDLIVDGVIGAGHMVGGGTQGFVSSFPDGTRRFLPFDYSDDLDTWFCNTAFVAGFWVPGADRAALRGDAGWLPITPDMRMTECGDWPPARILGTNRRFANCQNCHGSQIEVAFKADSGRYETRIGGLEINCESCHGPGADHVGRARSGVLSTSSDLGIAVLDTLDVDASLRTCFQCHALKRALEDQVAGLDVDYSLGLPLVGGDRPLFPDGRIRTFGYQQNHRASSCYLSGSMTCVDCHDPHSQGYRDPFGNALPGRFDDGQCTSCHASKAVDPEAHTFHPIDSEGGRCVSCHMPYLQHPALGDAIPYGRSDHTIPIPRPGFDESMGVQSACARCHEDRSAEILAAQTEAWWEDLKPHSGIVRTLMATDGVIALEARPEGAASARAREEALIAASRAGERHGLGKLMALDAWVLSMIGSGGVETGGDASALTPEARSALLALAGDRDPDVRAAALAALQSVAGDDEGVRARLDGARQAEADPEALERRWAAALTQWAFEAGRSRGSQSQLALLRRAQEVRPRAPETLVGLAAGLADVGALEEAVQVYLEALRLQPDNPVALVNLGLNLEVLGREAEAEAVYVQAAAVRPTEAVAHLNLGNARFRRGDLEAAIESYRE
ncbi:MAG: tetratricopeptide repeat protein, partial [Gemmatimonadota bacterium]|nr:tetratricopeptide repeat protein [Gemmatimonadota bacterium]